jgi:predicted  nucleic acid-binding Zn-ribbon protein
MSVTAATLRELHRIHGQLAELRGRRERGPKQIHAHEASVAHLQAVLEKARQNVKQTRMLVDKKQLELKAAEQRVVDWKVKLNACQSNKEYHALQEQIAAAEMAGSVLSDEILEGMDRTDALVQAEVVAQEHVAAGTQELAKVRDKILQTADLIQGDIERLEADLITAEAALPADFRADYNRVVTGKGADGLAPVEDGVCNGCGKQITLNMQNELLLSKPVFCRSCGRLLYNPEAA